MEKLLPISHWGQPFPVDSPSGSCSSSIQAPPVPKRGCTPQLSTDYAFWVHSDPTKAQGAEISLFQALEWRPPGSLLQPSEDA